MYPTMNVQWWLDKRKDINFMYNDLEVCDNCYWYVKDVTDEMKIWDDRKVSEHILGRLIQTESSIEDLEEDKN